MTDTVTLPQAIAAQKALRAALDLPDEHFPMPAFVGMLSDEIEQLRAAGRDDGEIARLINGASGATLDKAAIAQFYAPPEARRHG